MAACYRAAAWRVKFCAELNWQRRRRITQALARWRSSLVSALEQFRLRPALDDPVADPLNPLGGPVEVDETYIGGWRRTSRSTSG